MIVTGLFLLSWGILFDCVRCSGTSDISEKATAMMFAVSGNSHFIRGSKPDEKVISSFGRFYWLTLAADDTHWRCFGLHVFFL